jgi:hypothetical protein
MSFSPEIIDRIVANVLTQLSPQATSLPVTVQAGANNSRTTLSEPKPDLTPIQETIIRESVITADVLEKIPSGKDVRIPAKAIVTPAARDIVKARKLRLHRVDVRNSSSSTSPKSVASSSNRLLIVVQNTAAVDQLYSTLNGTWQRELVGCPDDAAKLAIAELSRGGASTVVILAEQTYRAAALANRHQAVKAVAIHEATEIRLVRQQLRANTWCVNPAGRTFFELRNLIQRIAPEN